MTSPAFRSRHTWQQFEEHRSGCSACWAAWLGRGDSPGWRERLCPDGWEMLRCWELAVGRNWQEPDLPQS